MHPFFIFGPCCTPPRARRRFFILFAAPERGLLKTIGNILGIWLLSSPSCPRRRILAHGMGRHHAGMQPRRTGERAGRAQQ